MTDPILARGKAPLLSDADLDDMAEITPDDIADAVAFWEAHAAEDDRGLIVAEPDEEDHPE